MPLLTPCHQLILHFDAKAVAVMPGDAAMSGQKKSPGRARLDRGFLKWWARQGLNL
jgi:hypothetical protein